MTEYGAISQSKLPCKCLPHGVVSRQQNKVTKTSSQHSWDHQTWEPSHAIPRARGVPCQGATGLVTCHTGSPGAHQVVAEIYVVQSIRKGLGVQNLVSGESGRTQAVSQCSPAIKRKKQHPGHGCSWGIGRWRTFTVPQAHEPGLCTLILPWAASVAHGWMAAFDAAWLLVPCHSFSGFSHSQGFSAWWFYPCRT